MRKGRSLVRSEIPCRFRQSAVAGAVCVLLSVAQSADSGSAEPASDGGLLAPGLFLHIPGPNPILVPGAAGAWDDGVIEAADAFHDDQTFYLYYHGTGQGKAVFLIRSIAPGDRAVIFWYIRENA